MVWPGANQLTMGHFGAFVTLSSALRYDSQPLRACANQRVCVAFYCVLEVYNVTNTTDYILYRLT